jgi:hypothetical protein
MVIVTVGVFDDDEDDGDGDGDGDPNGEDCEGVFGLLIDALTLSAACDAADGPFSCAGDGVIVDTDAPPSPIWFVHQYISATNHIGEHRKTTAYQQRRAQHHEHRTMKIVLMDLQIT